MRSVLVVVIAGVFSVLPGCGDKKSDRNSGAGGSGGLATPLLKDFRNSARSPEEIRSVLSRAQNGFVSKLRSEFPSDSPNLKSAHQSGALAVDLARVKQELSESKNCDETFASIVDVVSSVDSLMTQQSQFLDQMNENFQLRGSAAESYYRHEEIAMPQFAKVIRAIPTEVGVRKGMPLYSFGIGAGEDQFAFFLDSHVTQRSEGRQVTQIIRVESLVDVANLTAKTELIFESKMVPASPSFKGGKGAVSVEIRGGEQPLVNMSVDYNDNDHSHSVQWNLVKTAVSEFAMTLKGSGNGEDIDFDLVLSKPAGKKCVIR